MLNGMVAASFKDVIKSDDIALDINIGIGYRIAHTCLSGKVYDNIKAVFFKAFVNECSVGDIPFNEYPLALALFGGKAFDLTEPVFLYRNIVIIIHVVDADNSDRSDSLYKLGYKV